MKSSREGSREEVLDRRGAPGQAAGRQAGRQAGRIRS
jgi:hypothetical protein